MSQTNRKDGGLINKDKTLTFTFNGQILRGYEGDTLASALLANNKQLVGRSFKYHRPRGIVTVGSEEPNAIMEIGSGAYKEPNTRATVTQLYNGLEANSQNHRGPLGFDLMAITDFLLTDAWCGLSITKPLCGQRLFGKRSMSQPFEIQLVSERFQQSQILTPMTKVSVTAIY